MKIKVIFNPYCNFAIIGFSEMKLFRTGQQVLQRGTCLPGKLERGVLREHLPPQSEGKRNDEEHEQGHLCHQEQEDQGVVERHLGG